MSIQYNTRQRELVIATIKKMHHGFCAKELYTKLDGQIGLTTIYRLVEKLANEGILIKTTTEDNVAEYQYLAPCENEDHFFLKCTRCGKMKHVDCERIQGLTKHIAHEHNFAPTNSHIVINGLCKRCQKGVR